MSLVPIREPSKVPDLKDSLGRRIGESQQRWLDETFRASIQAIRTLSLGQVIALPRYGPTVTIDLSQGSVQKIVVTDGHAFTINAPINPTGLPLFVLVIVNSSGGPMGAVTFNGSIHQSGFVAPGNGLRTSAMFHLDGTVSYQTGGWSPAV